MTGLELHAPRQSPPDRPIRVRLPASRGGLAWLAVLLILGTFLAVQVGREVYSSWSIGRDAAEARAQIAAIEARNAALQRELDYLQSDAYLSAEARRLANVGLPGEQVVIIPNGAAVPLPPALRATPPLPKPLLEQWIDLFFGSSAGAQ
jgi:cell division protein FtsB